MQLLEVRVGGWVYISLFLGMVDFWVDQVKQRLSISCVPQMSTKLPEGLGGCFSV